MSSAPHRRAAFIAAWRSHRNIRRAMRETGVGSPTTAYRWIRDYERRGTVDWHLTRSPSRRVATEIADQIITLRQRNPGWGKLRIARHLTEQYGAPVVSPTGVRSVLRKAGLWTPPEIPSIVDAGPRPKVDRDALLRELQRGIQLDLFNRPVDAILHLETAAWEPLLRQPELLPALLQEPITGSWLLRGAVHLAHACIEAGRWASAYRYLKVLDDWLKRDDARPSARQTAWENEGERWISATGEEWRIAGDPGAGAERISLRQDDVWLEAQQYLGVVLRDAPGEWAIDALVAAQRTLGGSTPRRISPQRTLHYQGVIGHDLATLMLRRGWPAGMVLRELREAAAMLEECRNDAMLASASITRAKALARSRERGAHDPTPDRIEAAVWAAFGHAETTPSVPIRVRVAIEGTDLLIARGGAAPEDRDRLAWAAQTAIDHGLAVQARKLLEHPLLRLLVRDHLHALEGMLH